MTAGQRPPSSPRGLIWFLFYTQLAPSSEGGIILFFVVHNTCRIMKNSKIERLIDKDPELCKRLKQWCYDLNG